MERKYKARVFSLLVFPGTGHFILRRWWRGLLFAIPALWGLFVLCWLLATQTMEVFDQVLAGKLDPEFTSLYTALHGGMAGDAVVYNTSVALLIVTWVLAAADVWIIGNRK